MKKKLFDATKGSTPNAMGGQTPLCFSEITPIIAQMTCIVVSRANAITVYCSCRRCTWRAYADVT